MHSHNKITFEDCSCEFEKGEVNFDLHNPQNSVKFNCKKTYQILGKGLTEGVFQLRSPLGQQWSNKVQPSNLEHLAALAAILRPGALNSYDKEGISTTIHYERRKMGKEEIPSYHSVTDEILKKTYNCLIYQESAIKIVEQCAGFSASESDSLRKAIGKKIPEEMARNKQLFLERTKTFGILTEEQSIEVFNWIEASQRYSFCKAHAVEYGIIAYITTYIKAHFPVQFYLANLVFEKIEERLALLVNEAKLFDIKVHPPDLRHLKLRFYAIKNDIYFGLNNIKGVQTKDLERLAALLSEKKCSNYLQLIAYVLQHLSSKTVEGLIHAGALDFLKKDRAVMWDEYQKWRLLTPVETNLISSSHKNLLDFLIDISYKYGQEHDKKEIEYSKKVFKRLKKPTRKDGKPFKPIIEPKINERLVKIRELVTLLKSPVYNIQDTIDSIIYREEALLGVALSHHEADGIKVCADTHTCLQIAEGFKGYAVLKVKIDRASPYKCKNGTTMCFLELSDSSCKIGNVVAFSEVYETYQHLLVRNNLVFISGQKDKESFIIKKVYNLQ